MTACDFAEWCAGLGARGSRAVSPASAARCAKASEPSAPTDRPRNARRVARVSNRTFTSTSFDVQERVGGEQHLAQVGPRPTVRLLFLGIDRALRGEEPLTCGALVRGRWAAVRSRERQV